MSKTTWRVNAAVALGLVTAGMIVWAIIASIPDATYLKIQDEVQGATIDLIWVAAVCQTIFVLLWATRPWYQEWIGRAIMSKSLTIAVYLDMALVLHYVQPFLGLALLSTIVFGAITVSIVFQMFTLAWVVLGARADRDRFDA